MSTDCIFIAPPSPLKAETPLNASPPVPAIISISPASPALLSLVFVPVASPASPPCISIPPDAPPVLSPNDPDAPPTADPALPLIILICPEFPPVFAPVMAEVVTVPPAPEYK